MIVHRGHDVNLVSHVSGRLPIFLGEKISDAPGRMIGEPTGPIVDDPNLTDKKYPGNPTKSYPSREPLWVAGEVTDWPGHSPEALKAMKDHIERLRQLGVGAIDD
jgi:rifampin ADP-ribosylating transferase